jgi:hypothetical protein
MPDALGAPCLSSSVSRHTMSPRNATTALVLQVFTLALIFLASCSRPANETTTSRPSTSELLARWRAPGTPIGERLDCADGLLKTNMFARNVETLLGPPTRRFEDPPPPKGETAAASQGSYFHYIFRDGTIVVAFEQVTNGGRLEARYGEVGVALMGMEPGRTETNSPTNPQGGANGRQPSRSDTNETPAAAASRRSP